MAQATTETITGETISKIDNKNFAVEVVSTKVTPMNVDELIIQRQRHVDAIAKIDNYLSIAQSKGVDVLQVM